MSLSCSKSSTHSSSRSKSPKPCNGLQNPTQSGLCPLSELISYSPNSAPDTGFLAVPQNSQATAPQAWALAVTLSGMFFFQISTLLAPSPASSLRPKGNFSAQPQIAPSLLSPRGMFLFSASFPTPPSPQHLVSRN